jgi:hypothetical protein
VDEIVNRIMNSDNWPNIELPENLELLNDMADDSFSTGTFSGLLSAVLMYHQLVEAMCVHLLENCHFLIQLSVHPATIQYTTPKNTMLGVYVSELKESVSFHKKDEFLEKVTAFNTIRNEAIHKMRKSNLAEVSNNLRNARLLFDEIFALYDEIQDDFRVTFHSFKKDVFGDEY